jgi:hypothetical protein
MNPSLYHKFLNISIILDGLNPMETNKSVTFFMCFVSIAIFSLLFS